MNPKDLYLKISERELMAFRSSAQRDLMFGADANIRRTALVASFFVFGGFLITSILDSAGYMVSMNPAWENTSFSLTLVLVGAVGSYVALTVDVHPVAKGSLLGISALLLAVSSLVVLVSFGAIGDTGVLFILLIGLIAITAIHAYENLGLVVCWALVAGPASAFFLTFFVIYDTGITQPILQSLAGAILFSIAASILVGTVGFVLGWNARSGH